MVSWVFHRALLLLDGYVRIMSISLLSVFFSFFASSFWRKFFFMLTLLRIHYGIVGVIRVPWRTSLMQTTGDDQQRLL